MPEVLDVGYQVMELLLHCAVCAVIGGAGARVLTWIRRGRRRDHVPRARRLAERVESARSMPIEAIPKWGMALRDDLSVRHEPEYWVIDCPIR